MNNWNNLSMAQRAGVMRLAVENGVYDLDTIRGAYNEFAKGGSIHIKPENRGKFTRLKERTGHSATWFKEHGTPAQRKMATFALNARHWKHGLGGNLFETGGPKRPPIPRHPKTREQDPAAWDAYQDWLLQYGYEETKPYRDAAQIEYRDEVSERNERAAEKFNKEYNDVMNQLTDASTSIPFTAEAIKQAANEQRQEALDKLHDYKLGIRSLATIGELGLSGTSLLGAYSNWRNWANAANATKRTIANLLQKAQAPAQLGGVGIDAYQTLDAYGNNAFDTYYNGASGILGSAGTIGAMDVFRGRYPKVDRALDAMGILQNAGDFLKFGYDKLTGNERAVGGPLVEAANIYDGTTENSQQMNIMAYHPAEDYYTGPSAVMPEINVTRKKDGKTYVGLGDFSDRYDRKKRPYFVSSRTGQLTAANAAKAWDAMVTPALSWALPNVFRGIDAAQRGDAVGVGKEALKAAGLKVAGTVAANPSLAAPGSAFWMNPMTKQIAAGTAASEGVNLATNVLTPYNTWGEGISDVVNQATGWNPQDSWWGQTMAEATNPGWLVSPSRVMGAVGRVGSAVENGVKAAYDNGTLWDAYTTFGGRFGNYGDNLATNIYGTAARRFGLPDKARVPADAMRKIKGDVHVDNGVVDLTGNKPYLGNPHVNATLDRGVVSHSKGAWDGANTYITPTRNFLEQTQGSLKSIEPSDMFSNGARVTEAPQNVTLISGDVASLNKAREAGMQTLSSPRLRRIYQEEEAKYLAEKAAFDEQYANASGIQRLMLKAPESPKSKKWWPEYTKEVQRLQAQRGTPTLSDFRLLEEQTGLSSGTAPVSEMQNAVRQLEAMQNASISDIEAGRVQPYVYPNGRVVDWDKVAEELALIKRAKYNKVFYDPASYVESDWQVANGVK